MDKIEYQIIEHHILKLYLEIQKQIPTLHRLTFELNTHVDGRTDLDGFIHSGSGGCESYHSADELISWISKEAITPRNEILFRKFN